MSAAQAQAHGLPPIGFSFETGPNPPCMGAEFPNPTTYLSLQSPPGSAMGLTVEVGPDSLDGLLQERYGRFPLVVGSPSHVAVNGVDCECQGFICGTSHARTEFLMVRMANLLLTFARGTCMAPEPDPSQWLSAPFFGDVLRTFQVLG